MKAGDVRALGAVIAALVGFGLTVLIVGLQAYAWLKVGSWPELNLSTILIPLSDGSKFHDWILYPESWYGLNRVVKFLIDLPLFIWMLCCTSGVVYLLANEKPNEKIATTPHGRR